MLRADRSIKRHVCLRKGADMRQMFLIGSTLALLFVASGCADSSDKVGKDFVAAGNDLCDVLEKINTADDVDTHREDLEKLAARFKDNAERMKKLGQLDKDQEAAFKKQFNEDFVKIAKRLDKIETRLSDPKIAKKLDEIFKDVDIPFFEAVMDADADALLDGRIRKE